MKQLNRTERKQQQHYDKIYIKYANHYDDPISIDYRYTFIFKKLFKNIHLDKKTCLDAMCGPSGIVSSFLKEKGAIVHALDLSKNVMQSYKKHHPGNTTYTASILNTGLPNNFFDVISIVGGLHHTHPYLEQAIKEVQRILKPNGYLVVFEPPSKSLLNLIRIVWYKLDKKYFSEGEAAICISKLKKTAPNLTCLSEKYGGGPAYFLLYQSMITRMPKAIKIAIKTPLFFIETLYEKIIPSFFSAYVIVQFQKYEH
jgi:ubiquinone/menaquinone biosynthesis C-methylase UbiE